MKKSKVISLIKMLTFLCLVTMSITVSAQTEYELIESALTEDQRELLQTEREFMRANREALKASLTKVQMAILKDKSLTGAEIRKKLYESFSESQRSLVDNQERRIRKTREEFRRTLTRDQRRLLRDRLEQRVRDTKDRDELRGDRDRPIGDDRPRGDDGLPDGN